MSFGILKFIEGFIDGHYKYRVGTFLLCISWSDYFISNYVMQDYIEVKARFISDIKVHLEYSGVK